MDSLIHRLLDSDTAEELRTLVRGNLDSWNDGKRSAGTHAAPLKNNYQLDRDSLESRKAAAIVVESIKSDSLVKSFVLPRSIHGVMFTKSLTGQGYGIHVDNAYMSTGRSDISFTLFLSKPQDYEGGELSIQSLNDNSNYKLQPGEAIFYPSTYLHSVRPVTAGERLVSVGWIHSYISCNEDRNLLFNLDAASKGLLAKHGRSPELDLIFQSYANLLRRFGD